MTSVCGLITWAAISWTYIRFHKAAKIQGLDRNTLPYRAPLQPFLAYYGLIFCIIIREYNLYRPFVSECSRCSPSFTEYNFCSPLCLRTDSLPSCSLLQRVCRLHPRWPRLHVRQEYLHHEACRPTPNLSSQGQKTDPRRTLGASLSSTATSPSSSSPSSILDTASLERARW